MGIQYFQGIVGRVATARRKKKRDIKRRKKKEV
jgi:hypothetical protein